MGAAMNATCLLCNDTGAVHGAECPACVAALREVRSLNGEWDCGDVWDDYIDAEIDDEAGPR